MKQFLTALAVLVLIVGFGVGGYLVFNAETPSVSYGAAAGPDHTNHENFFANITTGGAFATSTAQSSTLTVKNITDVSRVDVTPNVASLTVTLPASSTMTGFAPKSGDTQEFMLCNATTTAAIPFTIAFGAGQNGAMATSSTAIAPAACAQLTFVRKPNKDFDVFYNLGY